jgi:hypothetical protein
VQTDRKDYVISAGTALSFAEAVNRTRDLLQTEGYRVEAGGISLRERQVIRVF